VISSGSKKGWPVPSRYDLVQENLLIVYPTLAAAVRATRWLDVGVALHLVAAHLELTSLAYTDLGIGLCFNVEYQPCDSTTHLDLDGFTATAALGLMFHPLPGFDIGLNVRGPIDLQTEGTVTATPPAAQPLELSPATARFTTHLPWVVRLGLRYAFLHEAFEVADVELDATYEAWSAAEGKGDQLDIPEIPPLLRDVRPIVAHHYQDTVSVRLGGAYNLALPRGVLAFRLGAFYDSAATKKQDTRIDFDTMDKWAGTVGLGYRIRGVSVNVAYAYVWSPDRDVTNGTLGPINPFQMGSSISASGQPLPSVNNGHYHAATQILSLGLSVVWDELRGHSLRSNRL
jgi:long-subunit fatty acid transport protein